MVTVILVLGVICLIDIIAFIFQAMGCASNLTYYICRPFGGLFGDGVSMFLGLVIRIVEVAVGAVCIGLSILTFFA